MKNPPFKATIVETLSECSCADGESEGSGGGVFVHPV